MLEDLDLKIASEKKVTAVDSLYSTGYWCPSGYLCGGSHLGCTPNCPQ